MPSQSNGPFTTLLMFVPLVVIPLLAIFGVPDFASVPALGRGSDDTLELVDPSGNDMAHQHPVDDLVSPVRNDLHSSTAHETNQELLQTVALTADDSFQPFEPIQQTRPSIENNQPNSWVPPSSVSNDGSTNPHSSHAGAGNSSRLNRPDHLRTTRPRRERELTDTSLTWRGAVQRLNQLGIHDFQLRPSDQPLQFHFSCNFTPADTPRISHRFEAEHEKPLQAVQKVIAQIELWSKRH